jgi:small-conductance mechanosensitive channel
MGKRFKISLMTVFFTLLNTTLFANPVDTVAVDSIASSMKLITEVTTETKEMSNYFSLTKILISIVILILTYLSLRIISVLLNVWGERTTKHRITIKGFIPVIRILAWLGSLSFILVAVFRPPMASILAFAASIGVAIGFAAQDFVKNIFGGIIILTDKPFQIGDKIQIGKHYGEVSNIGLRSTRLTTADDSIVSVPNAEVMSQSVSNANSGEENCQVVTEIFLPLSADLQRIRQSAIEAAQVSRFIFLNKPISVLIFQENIGHRVMLKVKVKAYVNDIRNEFALKSDITETLTNEFLDYYIEDQSINSGKL